MQPEMRVTPADVFLIDHFDERVLADFGDVSGKALEVLKFDLHFPVGLTIEYVVHKPVEHFRTGG